MFSPGIWTESDGASERIITTLSPGSPHRVLKGSTGEEVYVIEIPSYTSKHMYIWDLLLGVSCDKVGKTLK